MRGEGGLLPGGGVGGGLCPLAGCKGEFWLSREGDSWLLLCLQGGARGSFWAERGLPVGALPAVIWPPPFHRPSFEDHQRLGLASRRKAGRGGRAQSRYDSPFPSCSWPGDSPPPPAAAAQTKALLFFCRYRRQ